MDDIDLEFIQFIEDHIHQVRIAVEMLNQKLKEDKFFHIINKNGYLDEDLKTAYYFQAFSCSIYPKDGDAFSFYPPNEAFPTFEP